MIAEPIYRWGWTSSPELASSQLWVILLSEISCDFTWMSSTYSTYHCHEHHWLLHARPALVIASLNRRFHIISTCRHVHSITRDCITCRQESIKPQSQKMGKLPNERIPPSHPGIVFAIVGVDYAGPIKIKSGPKRKPLSSKLIFMRLLPCLLRLSTLKF